MCYKQCNTNLQKIQKQFLDTDLLFLSCWKFSIVLLSHVINYWGNKKCFHFLIQYLNTIFLFTHYISWEHSRQLHHKMLHHLRRSLNLCPRNQRVLTQRRGRLVSSLGSCIAQLCLKVQDLKEMVIRRI